MSEIDRVIHEPVRLQIMSVLTGVDRADFTFMLTTLGLSKGNLSSHVDKLERAGYVPSITCPGGLLRSAPAQKAGSVPVMTIERTLESSFAACRWS